mgnify:CR=1 FL=1
MNKIFISTLIVFSFFGNTLACFAQDDDFDYGLNKTIDLRFNDKFTINDNTKKTSTTIDFVPLFNRSLIVPVKKNISALIRTFCKMCSSTYDVAAVYLNSYCGDNSNYTFTVSGNNYSISIPSTDGEVGIGNIPEGEFSAYIENNDDTDLTCNTNLLGYGLDTTPEEGYHINLTCYDKLPDGEKTNMWAWLGPVVGVVGAAGLGFGGYAGVQKARGEDIIPGV